MTFCFKQNGASGSHLQGGASLGRAATTRDSVRFALSSTWQEENVARLSFSWKCGAQPVRPLPAPRYPERLTVVVNIDKMQARRRQVLAAMEGHPGQAQKSRVADEFDAFVLVSNRGWQTGTPDDVFNFLCFLGTQ